ncbi:MAG: ABC transporter permease [Candidatus Bipolaricaulota bacterium]|nr:ABC transporter permease [Candidatus Bipolaricaulota bacterium]
MRALGVLFWKELVYFRAYPLNLLNQAVSPALLVAPYLLVARMFGFDAGLTDSVAVGLLLWYWLSTLMWEVGFGIRMEMEEGVLEGLLASPVPIPVLLGAKGLATVVENAYLTACMVGWFFLFGVRLPVPWPAFVGLLLLSGLGLIGFMLLQAGLVLLLKRADAPGDVIQTGLGTLAGMTMPARLLPRPLWALSRAIPLAYGIEAARGLLLGAPVGFEVLLLAGLGAAYAFVGWRALAWAEVRMRASGTTGEF